MASSSAPTVSGEDALAMAALMLVGEGATAADLVDRFANLHAGIQPPRATALLERLATLGLVRVATTHGASPRYVLTSLGRQHASVTLAGQPNMAARLEELERLRSDLLSAIAHELRTPLTAIRTSAGLLLDPAARPDSATRQQLLQTIARSADRMQRVLADLLDLTRFRSGRVQLQLRRFDARQLAQDAATAMTPLFQERKQTLVLKSPRTPVWVYGDRRRLEQVLLNLLSNAHKFSPDRGQVGLEVDAAGGHVTWFVADQGPGIRIEDQPRLFERFFTTAGPTGAGGTGTGLGLPIALAIAQAHGGTIGVDTAVGRGSTFTLCVPAQGPPDAEDP